MKKFFLTLLAALLALGLMACGNGDADGTTTPSDGTTTPSDGAATAPSTEAAATSATTPTTERKTQLPAFDAEAAAPIVGIWRLEIRTDMGIEDFDTELVLPMQMTFGEDGSYAMSLISGELEENLAQFSQALSQHLAGSIYEGLADQGYEDEAADTVFQEAYGMSVQAYCDSMVESMDMSRSFSQVSSQGTYAVEGDILYISSTGNDFESNAFSVSADTLVLLDSSKPEDWAPMGLTFPATLTRYDAG